MPEDVKPKPVKYKFIAPTEEDGNPHPLYVLMNQIIAQHEQELLEFKSALYWTYGWTPNKDGKLTLGRARKTSEIERQMHGYHFIIELNYEWYHDTIHTIELQRTAVLHHELCHCRRELDKNGDTRKDENGEPVGRLACHDIEEFRKIIDIYGLYTWDLEQTAATIYNINHPRRGQNGATGQPNTPANTEETEDAA
jgi:hypothetical protein